MTAGDGMRMWGAIGRASLLGSYYQETGLKNQGRDDGWAPGGWFCFLKGMGTLQMPLLQTTRDMLFCRL